MLLRCTLFLIGLVIFSFGSNIFANILPLPSLTTKVSTSYDDILLKTWQGIKKRNIDPYSVKLVHRPKSETPNDAVSEGVGYGMLLALYCNDQEYFNKIWFAAEQYMWQGELYDWRVDENGKRTGTGAASDAEEDIAIALIFADQLVKKNIWNSGVASYNSVSYETRAKTIVASIKKNMLEGSYLRPGANWGGAGFVNPGYFAPAYYRVFAEFDSTSKTLWNSVIDQCYTTVNASPGFSKGLIPDWMIPDGKFYTGDLGYNPTGQGKWLYKDAIRVYWRLAIDYLWYDEPRAKKFLQNAVTFLDSPSRANFYKMDGTLADSSFTLGNKVVRPRAEHSHLTVAMWACASMAAGTETADKYSDELLKFYDNDADYWGRALDDAEEDTLHNEMYFDQFLAWFGASTISGVYANLWEDLKDPNPTLALVWATDLEVSTIEINADEDPLKITGEFNKPARWTVTLTHKDSSNATYQFSGSGTVIDVSWAGTSSAGNAMPQGFYDVVVNAKGLESPVVKTVWLAKAFNLLKDNRLLVDDFRDGDLKPFIGTIWTNYLDSYEASGKSTVTKLVVEKSVTVNQIHWQYHLDQGNLGFDPYAALEWNCVSDGKDFDLTGVDTVIITASAKSAVGVSFQLKTSDIKDYKYYEDSLYLTSQSKEYKIVISKMKPRLSGSAALALSKLQALRFQVQQKTGTENELIINNISFAGNVSKLYTAPPEYQKMGVIQRVQKGTFGQTLYRMVSASNGVTIRLNKPLTSGQVMIFNSAGRVISQTQIVGSKEINWNYRESAKSVVSGLYFVVIKNGNMTLATVPVHVMR